ncbi:hypothetical protein [Edaphobacter aggregans]|uniref:hypothetical protein n=1 Tax=Edaphobacter aggregans TaxID=570835 RepID=UPI000557D0D2|nr:hypothetical protein [Edaphobacter aggregans]
MVKLGVYSNLDLDIRELVLQTESLEPSHSATDRATPEELVESYEIDEELTAPEPSEVWIFDDVLTTGAHFKATKRVIQERFPGVRCVGIFLARRVPESDEI